MSNPRFVITDGTTALDFLATQGFLLRSWNPIAGQLRITRNESGLADGSAPVMARENNTIEEITFVARHATEDAVYEKVSDLLRLLRKAVEYWTSSWATPPVWIEARGPEETNTRYAVIVLYDFPGISDPFDQPLFTCLKDPSTLATLRLEHLPWQDVAPGTDTCIQTSATQDAQTISTATYKPAQNDDDAYVNTVLAGGTYVDNMGLEFGDAVGPAWDEGFYTPHAGVNTDDVSAELDAQYVIPGLNYLSFGTGTYQRFSTGILFNIAADIPAAATISTAHITFEAYGTNYTAPCNVLIRAEDAAAPVTFTGAYADFRDRPRTTAEVQWYNVGPWIAGNSYDTPDISPIIQEIITSHGAVNHLVLFLEDVAPGGLRETPGALRRPVAQEAPAGVMPTLHVTWTVPGLEQPVHTGIRFRNLTIPLGATILGAHLNLYSNAAEPTTAETIICYDADTTPPAFTNFANFMAQLAGVGPAHVHWTTPAWAANTWYETPDLKDMVQEYVDSWAGAAATEMTIFIVNNGSPNMVIKSFNAFNAGNREPQLEVYWTTETLTTFGRTATCNSEVYVANKSNLAQLTNIHRYVAAGGIWGPNRCGVAAINLLTTPPADGDGIYFGISTLASESGPFCNLVFDVGVAATYTGNAYCIWEYWNGAAWSALNVSDDTVAIGSPTYYGAAGGRPWGRTGVNSISWEQPSDWATYDLGVGVTAWWVRCRISLPVPPGDAITTVPTNANRPVYSTLWNNVNVAAAQVTGDLPVRGRIRAASHNDEHQTNCISSRLIVAARSNTRVAAGSTFRSIINFSDLQVPPDIYVAAGALGGFDGGTGDMTDAPTGRWIHAAVGAAVDDVAASIVFNPRVYEGTFHAYLRYIPTPSLTTASWPLYARLWQLLTQSSTAPVPLYNAGTTLAPVRDRMYIADLGRIRLHGMSPMKPEVSRTSDYPVVFLYLYNPTGTLTEVDLIDLILMPADEWIGDIRIPFAPPIYGTWPTNSLGSMMRIGRYLDADSARMSYYHTMSVLRNSERAAALYDTLIYTTHASEPITFQVDKAQDLHFLAMVQAGNTLGDALWCSYPYPLFSIQLSGVKRYILARGAR